jgi:uncharacterized iron-regulated membrane protein
VIRTMRVMKREDTSDRVPITIQAVAPKVDPVRTPALSSSHRHPLHRLWLYVHLYLGLFGGAWFVVIALTGGLLVFYKAIDEWLHPELLTTTHSGAYQSLDDVVEIAWAAGPSGGWLDGLSEPEHDHGTYVAWHKVPTADAGEFRWYQVTVDPYTGDVLARDREWGTYLVSFIYQLHESLLLGESGETIVGFMAIFLLLSIGTGGYLWWPRSGKVRQAFLPIAGASRIRRHYQWHKLSGAYSAIVLSVLAFTGVYLVFPAYVIPIVSVFSPVDEASDESPLQSHPVSGVSPLSVEQAVGLAKGLFPEGAVTFIGIPHEAKDVYHIWVRQPGDVRESGGNSLVLLDQYSGTVLKVRDWRSFSAGDTFVAWLFPLHNGEAFGLIGRWIVFFTGFIPCVLYVTALRMWWLKGQAHRRQKRHADDGV